MKEIGTVQSISANMATVVFDRHEACGSCRACTPLEGEKQMVAKLKNPVGAKVGDRVAVELKGKSMLSATAIAYGVPLIMLIIGAVVGDGLNRSHHIGEAASALVAIGFALMGYGILKLLNPLFAKKGEFSPVICDIIESEE
ncbi:MAG: hypothetical protein E7328_02855 [Clostridiales bacterium]|nr:hypothetical protein [Clostridiales bacterium]